MINTRDGAKPGEKRRASLKPLLIKTVWAQCALHYPLVQCFTMPWIFCVHQRNAELQVLANPFCQNGESMIKHNLLCHAFHVQVYSVGVGVGDIDSQLELKDFQPEPLQKCTAAAVFLCCICSNVFLMWVGSRLQDIDSQLEKKNFQSELLLKCTWLSTFGCSLLMLQV